MTAFFSENEAESDTGVVWSGDANYHAHFGCTRKSVCTKLFTDNLDLMA